MTEGEEIVALIKSYTDQGLVPQDDPQLASKLATISAKYAQQPTQTQQQTTTQDTGALANVGTDTQQQDDKVQIFSQVGQLGAGKGYSTIQDVIKSLGGGAGTVERLYFKDPETGRVFNYDYDDSEFENLDPGYYGKSLSDLQLISGISKQKGSDENVKFTVDDPSKYDVSGILGYDPETSAKMAAEQAKDDPSDNDVYYDVYNPDTGKTTTYVDVTGTGQSIPVGATNITRDPTQLGSYDAEGNYTEKDSSTYTQPVLTKTFQGYEPVTGMYSGVEGITPQQYANLSDAEKLKLAQSDVPTASTSFSDFFTPGSGRFDLGGYFGMDIDPTTGTSGLVLSNPPSNQFNLENFFNQTESFGTQNFLRSQSTDVLNDIIKEGNFLDALLGRNFKLPDGTMYYDKIYQPGYQAGFDDDGNYQVTGDAIQGFDMGQLEGFFNDLATNKDPYTGDTMYSNTAYGTDPFNISGSDDSNALQYDYAYSQRPLTAQAVRAYKGGLGPYANVGYLTRYGYNPSVGDEMLRYDEASGVYFDPVTNLPINPDMLEGFALSDPETVELGGTENVFRGQMTTNPTTGEKLYYDADGNPVTEEQYLTFTEPMGTGVT
tara:strand:- start:4120 stop:5928 length:1809 start_codon:yes stop_codon:yes gene_type:complete